MGISLLDFWGIKDHQAVLCMHHIASSKNLLQYFSEDFLEGLPLFRTTHATTFLAMKFIVPIAHWNLSTPGHNSQPQAEVIRSWIKTGGHNKDKKYEKSVM